MTSCGCGLNRGIDALLLWVSLDALPLWVTLEGGSIAWVCRYLCCNSESCTPRVLILAFKSATSPGAVSVPCINWLDSPIELLVVLWLPCRRNGVTRSSSSCMASPVIWLVPVVGPSATILESPALTTSSTFGRACLAPLLLRSV